MEKPPLHGFFDLRVYRGAVLWWLQGEPLYSFALDPPLKGFTYPPFAAVLLVPLTWLSAGPAAILVLLASAAVVVLVTWWLRRAGGPAARGFPVVRGGSRGARGPRDGADPADAGRGPTEHVIFALVLADVVALRRGRAWAASGSASRPH